ncbi:MAG TPA: VOC family protein [Polyangiales bacterium]|nr:VOC family protein [Polyangiales bacterium]
MCLLGNAACSNDKPADGAGDGAATSSQDSQKSGTSDAGQNGSAGTRATDSKGTATDNGAAGNKGTGNNSGAAASSSQAPARSGAGGAAGERATGSSSGGAASPSEPSTEPEAGSSAAGAPAQAGAGADTAGTSGDGLCSGCASETLDKMDMTIHLHHVHINTADAERSKAFYEAQLNAKRVSLNGVTEALQAEPVLLLLDQRDQPPVATLPTALQHIGWGSDDPGAWYTDAHSDGVEPDTRGGTLFMTGENPTIGESGSGASTFGLLGVTPPACYPTPDKFSYMYVLGPDDERIEIWSGADKRLNHLHFTSGNVEAAVGWYEKFLGLSSVGRSLLFSAFFLDDILFFVEPIGAAADYEPTDNHVLAHVAFSVTDLDAWLKRAREQSIEIVAEPAEVNGFKSFFVRGPDGMLVELVQAQPSQILCLDK